MASIEYRLEAWSSDCGVTLQHPCPFNRIGDRQIGYPCKRHAHRRCNGFTGGYDDALYTCACRCHALPEEQR